MCYLRCVFNHYVKGEFFDEMFSHTSRKTFPHYECLLEHYANYNVASLSNKQRLIENTFLEEGITFTVYGDNQGTERIFPFDLKEPNFSFSSSIKGTKCATDFFITLADFTT